MKTVFGLVGKGGFGREVIPIVKDKCTTEFAECSVVFVDDDTQEKTCNETPVLSVEEFESAAEQRYFNVAVGDPEVRKNLFQRLESIAEPSSVFAPSCLIYERVTIGQGALFCANTMVTSNVTIGRGFQCNIYSYVAHDCYIGDFVTFAPRVSCNGNVRIEDHAYIGTGAIIHPGQNNKPLIIGAGATIGMGAVVLKDVEPGATIVGNPGKVLQR